MKKKDVQNIIDNWKEEYSKRGVSQEDTLRCLRYVESLLVKDLPPILDLRHLSLLMGFDYLSLVRMAHGTQSYYREFSIPKRTGGERLIRAPYASLLFVQKWIYENILSTRKTQFCAHGFVRDRSILTNALQHQGCRSMLKLDIKDFFGSIPQEFVINYFYKELGYRLEVSYFLSCLCCCDGVLPQGAPTSPALSNLICISLDRRLYRLAKRFGLTYTRYADDIAFSGDTIPVTIIKYIKQIVSDCSLEINDKKTRLYSHCGSKIITGLSLSSGRPRITRDYRRKLKQELHYIDKYGLKGHMTHNKIKKANYLESLKGKLSFWLSIEPENTFALAMWQKMRFMS